EGGMGAMFIRPTLVAAAIVIAAVGSASPAYARGGHGGGSGGHGGGHGGGCYTATSGDCVERPTRAPSQPPGATAPCAAGTWLFIEPPSGPSSGHGGVSR